MKIINKVLITIILLSTIFLIKPQYTFCAWTKGTDGSDAGGTAGGEVTDGGGSDSSALYDADSDKTFLSSLDRYKTSGESSEETKKIINNILSILIALGVVMAVVIIAIIGFQTVLGSAEEKAVNHEQMMTFVVGAIVLLAGSTIVKILYNVATSW